MNVRILVAVRSKPSKCMLLRSGKATEKVFCAFLCSGKPCVRGGSGPPRRRVRNRLVEAERYVMWRSGGMASDLNSRPPFLRFLLSTSSSLGSLLSKHIQYTRLPTIDIQRNKYPRRRCLCLTPRATSIPNHCAGKVLKASAFIVLSADLTSAAAKSRVSDATFFFCV